MPIAVQAQLVVLELGPPHDPICGIVLGVEGDRCSMFYRDSNGSRTIPVSTILLRAYDGRCPACVHGEPDDAPDHILTCRVCHYAWIDPRWLYNSTNAADAVPGLLQRIALLKQRIEAITGDEQAIASWDRERAYSASLEQAVQSVASLIEGTVVEGTVPDSLVALHEWLDRPEVRAARGFSE
jgi:hypothetical protein